MLSLCEAFTNIGSLLGIYSDRPTNNLDNTWCCLSFLTKVIFLIVDFISSSLDWNVAFQLSKGNFQIIGNTSKTEEVGDTEVLVLTVIYIAMMVISHLVFLRGKWFYLQSGDWAAFSMTEIVIYAVEDVTTIFLFLVTRGFFDPNEFLDRFNVIISNVSGYLVATVLWLRLFSCQRNDEGLRAPCSAYVFPICFTVEIVLISLVSYRTLFLQKWDSAFDANDSGDDVGIFDWLLPIIAGSWAGVMFFWLLVFLCKWAKCLNWARQDGGAGGGRGGEEHNLCGFLTVWTVMFGVTIVCGYFLSLIGKNEYDWIQSYSDIPGEIQEKQNKTTVLRFGHTVAFGANGDRNGKGASIFIGALDPYNVSAGYSGVAGLCDPPCIATNWTIGTIVLNKPFCTYPSALAGFETNWTTSVSQGFVRKSYYKDHYFYGPQIILAEETNDTNIEKNSSLYWTTEETPIVSVAAGGSNVYDLTPGVEETPNPSRVVVGYPYGNNGTKGLVQTFQVYKQSFNTGGFVNTARDVLQIGQDILYESGGSEESSFEFGDQVSMGRSNPSRFATTYVRNKDGSKVILFYDYNKNNDYWDRQTFELTNKFENDEFGHSMELNYNGDRVVVGAPGYQKGFVYVYEYQNSSTWVQIGEAIVPTMNSEDDQQNDDLESLLHFGFAVSINEEGNRIAAAGETQDSTIVFIFEQKGSSWVQMGSPIIGEAGNFQAGYRHSLSLNDDGKFIAIGGIGEEESLGLGRVRVFKYSKFI